MTIKLIVDIHYLLINCCYYQELIINNNLHQQLSRLFNFRDFNNLVNYLPGCCWFACLSIIMSRSFYQSSSSDNPQFINHFLVKKKISLTVDSFRVDLNELADFRPIIPIESFGHLGDLLLLLFELLWFEL